MRENTKSTEAKLSRDTDTIKQEKTPKALDNQMVNIGKINEIKGKTRSGRKA